MDAAYNDLDPDRYSLHSIRPGGEAALYRATGDLDLAGDLGCGEERAYMVIFREVAKCLLELRH